MRWSMGFGLERIGLLALRFPIAATVFLVLSLVAAGLALPNLNFDGNVTNAIDPKSAAYKAYVRQGSEFHDFSKDITVILSGDNLMTADALNTIRDGEIDIALAEGVVSAYSVFTLADSLTGENEGLPEAFDTDEQAKTVMAEILRQQPAMRAIFSLDPGAMMILVRLDRDESTTETELDSKLARLKADVRKVVPADIEIQLGGLPVIRASIVEAIISDQTMLTGIGMLLGSTISWFVFRSLIASLISVIPVIFAELWLLASFAFFEVDLNFFTTSLPSLALIIVLADTLVLYYRWQTENERDDSRPIENMAEAIRRVGPASALTSITTAIAFGSFAYATTPSIDDLAFFGVLAVSFAFLAFIISVPVACYWAVRFSGNRNFGRPPRVSGQGSRIAGLTTAAPRLVMIVALSVLAVTGWIHTQLQPSYAITEYLPYGSDIRKAEAFADKTFGGTSQFTVLLPVTEGGAYTDEENQARLIELHDTVATVFGAEKTRSLANAWRKLSPDKQAELIESIATAPPALRGQVLSKDDRTLQVSATTEAGSNTLAVERELAELRAAVDALPFGPDVTITGLSALLAEEFPNLIGQLRTGLLVSIFLGVMIIGVATRDPVLALSALVPNLIPILMTESVIWLAGASLSVTNVIALTIAFGIAIDNAIHVINAYRAMEGRFGSVRADVERAVAEISPALFASVVIICAASSITMFSAMPSVAMLGVLLISTLIVALISNLAILPSAMIVLLEARARFAGKEAVA